MLDTQELVNINWPETAEEIPRDLFVSPEIYRAELQRIFAGPTWHLVAHEAELPENGDFKTMDIGEVPIVVIRNQGGELRALVNACAHRGAKVVPERWGNATSGRLQCIYHMWMYDSDGHLLAYPFPDGFPDDFAKEDHGLKSLRLETAAGAVFVTLDPMSLPLREYLGEVVGGLESAFGDGDLVHLGTQTLLFHCNWKLYFENICDNYHAPALHAAVRMIFNPNPKGGPPKIYQRMVTTGDGKFGHSWTQVAVTPPAEEDRTVLSDYSVVDLRCRDESSSDILGLFPSAYVSSQLDTLQIRYAIPRGMSDVEVTFSNFGRRSEDEELINHRVRQGSNLFGPEGLITLEDATALGRAQAAAAAPGSNALFKGVTEEPPYQRSAGEAGIRQFYAAYRTLMGL